MPDPTFRIMELSLQGFKCAQILAILAMEARGEESPELVRAASGLLAGLGCGRVCGCLTGGCCVLGLHAGRGTGDEREDPNLPEMLTELVVWFEKTYGALYGGASCEAISHGDLSVCNERCPGIVAETFRKTEAILAAHGHGPDGETEDAEVV